MTDTRKALDPGHLLVSSRRVEGTPVYGPAGRKLGTVHSVMIEKRTGKVAYALLAFGGFLGLGEHVHPIPWELLSYDTGRDGYLTDLDRETLKNAPVLTLDEADRPRDRAYDEEIAAYYGRMPWWGM